MSRGIFRVNKQTARHVLTLHTLLAVCILLVVFVLAPTCGMASDDPGGPHSDPLASATWHGPYRAGGGEGAGVSRISAIQMDNEDWLILMIKNDARAYFSHVTIDGSADYSDVQAFHATTFHLQFIRNDSGLFVFYPHPVSNGYIYQLNADSPTDQLIRSIGLPVTTFSLFYPTIDYQPDGNFRINLVDRTTRGNFRSMRVNLDADTVTSVFTYDLDEYNDDYSGAAHTSNDGYTYVLFTRYWFAPNGQMRRAAFLTSLDSSGAERWAPVTTMPTSPDSILADWVNGDGLIIGNDGAIYCLFSRYNYTTSRMFYVLQRYSTEGELLGSVLHPFSLVGWEFLNPMLTMCQDRQGRIHVIYQDVLDPNDAVMYHNTIEFDDNGYELEEEMIHGVPSYCNTIKSYASSNGDHIFVILTNNDIHSSLYCDYYAFYDEEVVNISLGVDDEDADSNTIHTGITVYPNPSNQGGLVTINNLMPGPYSLSIHNILGQLVYRNSVVNSSGLGISGIGYKLPLPTTLRSGLYILSIENNSHRYQGKLYILK